MAVTHAKAIFWLGVLATLGAAMGVAADVLSAWSGNAGSMATAFSVGLDDIKGLYLDKPRWTWVLGNFIGIGFIPLHIAGFFLVYQALRPAGLMWSRIFLASSLYLVPVGVGLHGTLAFVGDIVRSGDAGLLGGMRDYWEPWAYAVAAGYALASVLIAGLILTGRSVYPRWMVLASPLGVALLTAAAGSLLPGGSVGLRNFLSVTGLNLPLLIFFPVTTWLLLHRGDHRLTL
jgi:hypothetical protein